MYELKFAPEEIKITPIKLFLKGFLYHNSVKLGISRAAAANLPSSLRLSVYSVEMPVSFSILF
jgi:hypothetical protein